MTAEETAEALLEQLDTTGTPAQWAGVCYALVALYWRTQARRHA